MSEILHQNEKTAHFTVVSSIMLDSIALLVWVNSCQIVLCIASPRMFRLEPK